MKIRTADNPDPATALSLVRDALADGWLLAVLGRCSVDYDGRATSSLGPGDRLVVWKPDGTVLVHAQDGRTPVNWQPPGSATEAAVDDRRLCLRSTRTSPDEELAVRFGAVYLVGALDATDRETLALHGTETDLRERVLDDPSLVETGFVPEAVERSTAAGSADVVGRDGDGRRVVLELKRRRVGPGAVAQLRRYVGALERETDEPVRGLLVSPSVTEGGAALLAEHGLEHVSVAPRPDDGGTGGSVDRESDDAPADD